jgi:thiosulfate reductase cytochrome b subunit
MASCVIVALDMAELAQVSAVPARSHVALRSPRHSVVVRITHGVNFLAFLALLTSGVAILLAHPRFYWGETGAFGSPALIELPLPLNLDQSGWGRSLHFLAAWLCVLNGAVYLVSGMTSHHFKTNMLPDRAEIAFNPILKKISDAVHWRKPSEEEQTTYNVLQRITYLTVVFALFPLMIVTGLAMSPAVTAVIPVIVEVFGGYQSSRTVHFLATNLLVFFLIIHIVMVRLAGFWNRTRPMITGREAGAKESI